MEKLKYLTIDSLAIPSVGTFAANLQEYIMIKDTRFYSLVKESKKMSPEAEAILKEIILKVKQEL